MNEIDFIITTFERYDLLEKLLVSIRKYYPTSKIIICDDSIKFTVDMNITVDSNIFYVRTVEDIGLSAKRNILVSYTDKSYILLLEDDFEFTDNTKIEKMLEIMKREDADIVGGKVINWDGQEIHFEHRFARDYNTLMEVEDFKKPDAVLNFALFNRRVFEKCLWDEELKLAEHNDFYLRLKQFNPKIIYAPEISIKHNKNNDLNYKQYRSRANEFLKIMMRKNNLKFIYKSNGKIFELLPDDTLKTYRKEKTK